MNDDLKRMLDEPYDESREDTYRDMFCTFYSRKMRSTAILVWGFGLLFFVGVVYSAVEFFGDTTVRDQIMYAALFVSFWFGVGIMKVFAWEMLHRHSIKREIKRVELRIAELTETVKRQS